MFGILFDAALLDIGRYACRTVAMLADTSLTNKCIIQLCF